MLKSKIKFITKKNIIKLENADRFQLNFLILITFLFLKTLRLDAANSVEKRDMYVEKNSLPGYVGLPQELLSCQTNEDCVTLKVSNCEYAIPISRKQEASLKFFIKNLSESELDKKCVNSSSKGNTKKSIMVECSENLCGFKTGNSKATDLLSGQNYIKEWNERCPAKEWDLQFNDLPLGLKNSIQLVYSPLGWIRSEGLKQLAQMKGEAEKSIPWLLQSLQDRESFNTSAESLCVIGDIPTEQAFIDTLGSIKSNPHPAVMLFRDWLKDERQRYRHNDILQYLKGLGAQALPTMDVLEVLLENANDKKWRDDRVPLVFDVINGIGNEANTILPWLLQWLQKTDSPKLSLLQTMINLDPRSPLTKKAAFYVLEQDGLNEAKLMSIYFLTSYPKEFIVKEDLLKKIINVNSEPLLRLGAFQVIMQMEPVQSKIYIQEIAQLGLQGDETLRRQVALVLKKIDPDGSESMETLKKRVYQGMASESQYIWKLIDSPLTRLELFKSYFYFVTGKRYKFTEIKVDSEMEKQLVTCIESVNCANRTSAIAALVLLNSNESRIPTLLSQLLQNEDSTLRWEASGAFILMYDFNPNLKSEALKILGEKKFNAHLTKAWSLQKEALENGGVIRRIDLEDIILKMERTYNISKLSFLNKIVSSSDNNEAVDALLTLADLGESEAREQIVRVINQSDKQKRMNLLLHSLFSRGDNLNIHLTSAESKNRNPAGNNRKPPWWYEQWFQPWFKQIEMESLIKNNERVTYELPQWVQLMWLQSSTIK